MHRTYKPILPTHNKLLQQRWDNAYYEEHRRRLASAAPTIDTKAPRTYMHIHLKLKRMQVDEERLAIVERDNRILLGKMSTIMKTQGGIDNQNPYECKSLNREKRLRELLRVTKENEQIAKRILNKKPLYDHEQWDRDWIANQRYMDQIAAYPKDWWKPENQSRLPSANSKGRSKSASTTFRSQIVSATERSETKAPRESKASRKSKASRESKESEMKKPAAVQETNTKHSSAQKTADEKSTKPKDTISKNKSLINATESTQNDESIEIAKQSS